MAEIKSYNILIGVTGSVATIKLVDLIEKLFSSIIDLRIKVIQTQNSKHFVSKDKLMSHFGQTTARTIQIFDDQDEWNKWVNIGDPVLHVELRRWADILIIAPLDANTMAKMANGFCDNLLTCVIRAWDKSKPLLYCPAMNTHMYEHPLTAEHLSKLDSLGYSRINCVEKKLACGDIGLGGMAAVDIIVEKVIDSLLSNE